MIRNETLSTFIFVLSLWIFLTIYRNKEDDKWHYVALSILVSLAGLTKPLLLLLGPIYASFFILIWLSKPISIFSKKSYFLCFILPYVIIILTWCLFNKITVDYFGPTTYTSYNLTQHSGAFIELAPDRYSTIKEIYLKHRQKRVSESGSHSMTIWRALPEMQAATGLDFSHLSQKLTSISIELFIQHPLLYFKSVFKAWAKFWETTLYWRLDRITPLGIRKVIQYVWVIQRSLLAGLYVIFSAIVIRWIDFIIFKKSSGSVFNSLLIFIILVSSVAQSLLEFGENSRYAIPFQPLILYLVFVNMWFYIASYHKASNIN